MRCPKCRSEVYSDEQFCRYCGERLNTNTIETQYNYQVYQMLQNSDDEILLDAYIGKNTQSIKLKKFNPCMFVFGSLYLLYRKMWLYGIGLFLISVIVNIFIPIFSTFVFITIIYLSFNFNKIYIKNAEITIEKIKRLNSEKSTEQLTEIVKKKGGTSILAPILAIVVTIIFLSLMMLLIFGDFYNIKEKIEDIANESNLNQTKETLKYTIPSGFEVRYKNNSYYSYSYKVNKENCDLTITSYTNYNYENASKYLEDNIYYTSNDDISEIKTEIINDKEWARMVVEKSYATNYYYVALEGERVYKIEFTKYDKESANCDAALSVIINSLSFK